MVKVECTVTYNDLQLNRLVEKGEQLEVTKERADYLVNERELAKVIEVIPEEVKVEEVKLEEKKEVKKPVAKKTSKKK